MGKSGQEVQAHEVEMVKKRKVSKKIRKIKKTATPSKVDTAGTSATESTEPVKMKASEARRLQKALKRSGLQSTTADSTQRTPGAPEMSGLKGSESVSKPSTIFVRGMPPSFDQDAFKILFEKCGEIIELSVPMRKVKPGEAKRGRKPVSRGIAFIQYASNKGAKRALKQNRVTFDGSTLNVTMSKSDKVSADSAGADKKAAEAEKKDSAKHDHTVFVTNIPHAAEEADVRAHFRGCGNISGCRVLAQKGIAFIRYKREEGFVSALQLNGEHFQGRELNVSKALSKSGAN